MESAEISPWSYAADEARRRITLIDALHGESRFDARSRRSPATSPTPAARRLRGLVSRVGSQDRSDDPSVAEPYRTLANVRIEMPLPLPCPCQCAAQTTPLASRSAPRYRRAVCRRQRPRGCEVPPDRLDPSCPHRLIRCVLTARARIRCESSRRALEVPPVQSRIGPFRTPPRSPATSPTPKPGGFEGFARAPVSLDPIDLAVAESSERPPLDARFTSLPRPVP